MARYLGQVVCIGEMEENANSYDMLLYKQICKQKSSSAQIKTNS